MSAHAAPRLRVRFKRPRWPRWSRGTRCAFIGVVIQVGSTATVIVAHGTPGAIAWCVGWIAIAVCCFEFCRRSDKHDDGGAA